MTWAGSDSSRDNIPFLNKSLVQPNQNLLLIYQQPYITPAAANKHMNLATIWIR